MASVLLVVGIIQMVLLYVLIKHSKILARMAKEHHSAVCSFQGSVDKQVAMSKKALTAIQEANALLKTMEKL